ncbi:murein L,D-transpeptidase catalytic domain family protein [Hyphomonas sp. WL0036]|uniref:murein L,D-transpeptidase catalytic domain-containing protein n=1 Tax=Hyphomonas sediminis TaxID=2866160 RepID=UPI001C817BAE|nr:murein L,D-transpeptidase catalytic domain family protein [Hyphomonas sediminis]MBY9068341.1 murein L,D-transpeptidase catalytic domain family protein [Hyphomonas sediminis]
MSAARFAFALILLAFSCVDGRATALDLDPSHQVRPSFLSAALAAAEIIAPENATTGKLVVVDYSLHSSKERLFVLDLETGAVSGYRVSHGLGSDPDHDGYLDSFSSIPGSQASPEGVLRMAEEYTGKHGRSIRLDGLEKGNRTARSRAIVIHAASYAEPGHLTRYGKLGRSNGCIVFSQADLERFLAEVPEGTLIFVGK